MILDSSVVIICTFVIVVCSIAIIIATKFQRKQKQKYEEIKDIIKNKKDATFQIKNGLTKEEINNIDSSIDVDKLMKELYDLYLKFENRIKKLDTKLDDVLTQNIIEIYLNKIRNFKENNIREIKDSIELVNYSIVEYNKYELKFRVTINCLQYKTINDNIISGSNLEKIEQILLIEYNNENGKWLINDCDTIYEKKLSV